MGVFARGRIADGAYAAEWVFTDRHGGVSQGVYASLNLGASVEDDPAAVAANRALAAAYLGGDALALIRQVHGRDVVYLQGCPDEPPSADAALTRTPDLILATQVADCVPILLADVVGGQVAAVHAGWRGVAADVVGAALDAMAAPGPVQAWIGPAICPGCYEVSEQVREEICDVVPEAWATTRQGTPAVDVRAGVLAQLAARDITGELIGGCTYESADLYSYRRDGVTGRQMGLIVLRTTDG